jgi:hypothetical protein
MDGPRSIHRLVILPIGWLVERLVIALGVSSWGDQGIEHLKWVFRLSAESVRIVALPQSAANSHGRVTGQRELRAWVLRDCAPEVIRPCPSPDGADDARGLHAGSFEPFG